MGKITVISPSNRVDGLKLVCKALEKQTFKDFEWIVMTPFHNCWIQTKGLDTRLFSDPKKKEGDVWTLNKAMNAAIECAQGDLIISWQDYTYAKPDTLERFWYHYQDEPKTLVTAVGNKYDDETWSVINWADPRERADYGSYYPCFFNDIEFNLCSIPKKALFAVGGYDEYLDAYFGLDGYSMADRLNILGGWDFKIDQSIKSYSIPHGRPPDWDSRNAMNGPYEARRVGYLKNPVLNYLIDNPTTSSLQ